MATLDDLSQGVVTALAGLLFPGSNYLAGSVANVISPWSGAVGGAVLTIPTKLYRGAPQIAELNADIAAGVSNICVTCVPGMSRRTTRFQPYYSQATANAPTLSVRWTSTGVTFYGACGAGQAVGVTSGAVCYAYRLLGADTPVSVAAAFAAAIPGASSTGATLLAASISAANVVCDQVAMYHTGQEQQMVQVAILAPNIPNPAISGKTISGYLVRAALARRVDLLKTPLDANGNVMPFIGLPDSTAAKITFARQSDDDTPRNNNIWRRWSFFICDYDEAIPVVQNEALAVNALMSTSGAGGFVWLGNSPAITQILTDGNGNALVDLSGDVLGTF